MDFNNIFVYLIGLTSSYAYDDLSFHKVASQSSRSWLGWFFPNASSAVDRNTTTCAGPYGIGSSSQYKTVWWKVDLGAVYGIYSVTVLFKNYDGHEIRQRGRFAGFSVYISSTNVTTTNDIKNSTLCYKDGPQLPPLNFTTTCIEYGRYVIFYNERLDGVTYPKGYELSNVFTELCEVIVQGCKMSGVYGSNCDISCPTNCENNTCEVGKGTCFGCNPGWKGTFCITKCMAGWYGLNCSQQCVGHCIGGITCNHVTGMCDRGCAHGWTGHMCDSECVDGTYGYACVNNCSGHCLNGSHCNKQTGHCDRGCDPGYTNNDCSQACNSGNFGLGCSERCSSYCKYNDLCNHVSGICPRGCNDGYIGGHCQLSCQPGYYGTKCSFACLPNCKTCRHTDGLCSSCKAGWMGHNCSIECTQSYGENCQYTCSTHCMNQTCDRFNGHCLCNDNLGSLQNTEASTEPASTVWIVAFSTSLLINITFISATLINRRRTFWKQRPTRGQVNLSTRPVSNTEPTVTRDDPSHYQELTVSQTENTYQTLHQQ